MKKSTKKMLFGGLLATPWVSICLAGLYIFVKENLAIVLCVVGPITVTFGFIYGIHLLSKGHEEWKENK